MSGVFAILGSFVRKNQIGGGEVVFFLFLAVYSKIAPPEISMRITPSKAKLSTTCFSLAVIRPTYSYFEIPLVGQTESSVGAQGRNGTTKYIRQDVLKVRNERGAAFISGFNIVWLAQDDILRDTLVSTIETMANQTRYHGPPFTILFLGMHV